MYHFKLWANVKVKMLKKTVAESCWRFARLTSPLSSSWRSQNGQIDDIIRSTAQVAFEITWWQSKHLFINSYFLFFFILTFTIDRSIITWKVQLYSNVLQIDKLCKKCMFNLFRKMNSNSILFSYTKYWKSLQKCDRNVFVFNTAETFS